MAIVDFDNAYANDFKALNIEWLETFFYVEPYDLEVLSHPDNYIINKGGYIFFYLQENIVLGTVALMPMKESNVYELTKMAVSPKSRGLGIGQKLMKHCIMFSKDKQFEKLVLYSNTKLKNAIYIYKKWGFKEILLEANSIYERSNIKMELDLKKNPQ